MKSLTKLAILAALILSLAPEAAWAKALLIARVDISSQTMTVSRNGAVIDRWKGNYSPPAFGRMSGADGL